MDDGSTHRTTARRLTEAEREQIISLRLRGVSVRRTAEIVDTTPRTVQATWTRWLADRRKYFTEEVESERAHLVSRLLRVANEAASKAQTAEKDSDQARFLAEERQALLAISRLLGVDVQKVEHSGELAGGFTVLRIVEEVEGDG